MYLETMLYNGFVHDKKIVKFQNKIIHLIWNASNFEIALLILNLLNYIF